MPRKTATVKTKAHRLSAERLKAIRPFVSFNYDLRKPLSEYAQRKIKKYHDEITALTNRPYQVYRPRLRDHLEQAQEFAQHEKRLPALKVAFLPTDGTNKVRLEFTKHGVIGRTRHVTMRDVRLSLRGLLSDPEKEVNRKIAGNPAKQYTVQAGRYEIPQPYLPDTIGKAVARLVARYGEASGLNDDDNHYFGHWLHGLKAYSFEGQADLQEYLIEKRKAIKAGKRKRANMRRRARRIRETT